jgi:hypothetical protein
MRNQTILLALLASLTASGCQMIECADGTIERDGRCMPAVDPGPSICGPFTELQGDRCVPQFPPTVCEEGAESELDPATGVTICKGGGETPCGFPLTCSKPTGATKQTFCGQLYDFETNIPFAEPGVMTGDPAIPCDPGNPTTGPCGLKLIPYDALAFAANPATALPLAFGTHYLDNCGRFRLKDVETSGVGPFIGLGVDDASGLGPTGVTVTVAVAAPKQANMATANMEHFIVTPATIDKWTGGPPLSGGIYAPIFRKHKLGNGPSAEPQPGVTMTRMGNEIPNNDFYFQAAQTTRTTIDPNATATGANGTALVTNAVAGDGLIYSGKGGITDTAACKWDERAGASLRDIVFVQIFRKLDVFGKTCME